MNERMDDEAERWFYDLGRLAAKVDSNYALSVAADDAAREAQRKAEISRKRLLVLTLFVLFAFLLLAWRNEVNADRISEGNARISGTQQATCLSGLEIIKKFNAQQNALIAVERINTFVNDEIRDARIAAYENVRIEPLPICTDRP